MPEDESKHKLLSIHDAAAYLGVHRSKLTRMMKQGKLAYLPNPLDERQKVISIEELDKLKAYPPAEKHNREESEEA